MAEPGNTEEEEERAREKKAEEEDLRSMSSLSRAMTELAPFLNIGWVWVASIGTFALIGWRIDVKRGGGQTFLAIGATFGVLVGFVNFFKVVLGLGKRKR